MPQLKSYKIGSATFQPVSVDAKGVFILKDKTHPDLAPADQSTLSISSRAASAKKPTSKAILRLAVPLSITDGALQPKKVIVRVGIDVSAPNTVPSTAVTAALALIKGAIDDGDLQKVLNLSETLY